MQTVTSTKLKHVLVCQDCDTPTLSCSECFAPFIEAEVIVCVGEHQHYCTTCYQGGVR